MRSVVRASTARLGSPYGPAALGVHLVLKRFRQNDAAVHEEWLQQAEGRASGCQARCMRTWHAGCVCDLPLSPRVDQLAAPAGFVHRQCVLGGSSCWQRPAVVCAGVCKEVQENVRLVEINA